MNVQLSNREAIQVWVDSDTKRILGFTPERVKLLYGVAGFRYTSEVLRHASDIERWLAKYRIQQEQDAYEKALLRIKREERFRKALTSAIRQRNESVNPLNRDLNNMMIRLMDERYNKIIQSLLNPVTYGMAEAYEESTNSHEVALDSPYFKHGPERIAEGDRVDPREAK
jgi:hypothetical protein